MTDTATIMSYSENVARLLEREIKSTKRSMRICSGWLFDIGDYTTQLYKDYDKPL